MLEVYNSIEFVSVTSMHVVGVSEMCKREGFDVKKWDDYRDGREYKNIQTVINLLLHG